MNSGAPGFAVNCLWQQWTFVSGHTQILYMHQQEIPNSRLKSPRFLSYVEAHSWKMRKAKKVTILIILHEHDVWCKPSRNNQYLYSQLLGIPHWHCGLQNALLKSHIWTLLFYSQLLNAVIVWDFWNRSNSEMSHWMRCHQIVQLSHVIVSCRQENRPCELFSLKH